MSIDKKILSIDSDDDNENYDAFFNYLDDDTKRKKAHIANEFNQVGEKLLKEIERKKRLESEQKEKYIKYILKHSNSYDYEDLHSYELSDVKNIYDDIKTKRTPAIIKFFHFLFNL